MILFLKALFFNCNFNPLKIVDLYWRKIHKLFFQPPFFFVEWKYLLRGNGVYFIYYKRFNLDVCRFHQEIKYINVWLIFIKLQNIPSAYLALFSGRYLC